MSRKKNFKSLLSLSLLLLSFQTFAVSKSDINCIDDLGRLVDGWYKTARGGWIVQKYRSTWRERKAENRRRFWNIGENGPRGTRVGGIKWFKYIGSNGLAKARYWRDHVLDHLVANADHKYPIIMHTDIAYRVSDKELMSTVDVAKTFPSIITQKGIKPSADLSAPVKDLEQAVVNVAMKWMDDYRMVREQLNELIDELTALEINEAAWLKHKKTDGFIGQGQSAPEPKMYWWNDGVREEVIWPAHDYSSWKRYLKQIRRRQRELTGSTFPGFDGSGEIRQRIIAQAMLYEKIDILGREIRNFLNNSDLTGLSEESVQFLRDVRKQIRRDFRRNKEGGKILGKFDISEWGIKTLKRYSIVREIKSLFEDPVTGVKNGFGAFFKLVGSRFNKKPISDFGQEIQERELPELKKLYDEHTSSAAQRRHAASLGPVRRVYRGILTTTGYASAITGTAFVAGESQKLYDTTIIMIADLYHKFWGSKNDCINAEVEDLASYDYQADPKLFETKIAKMKEEIGAGATLHDVVMEAMRKDEVFRLCLFNHYKLRYGEMIKGAKFFKDFDPMNPEVPRKYKTIFNKFVDYIVDVTPFVEGKTKEDVVDDLYEEFVILFFKRYIYLRNRVVEDKTNKNIALVIEGMFEKLANDDTYISECSVARGPEYNECLVLEVSKIDLFKDMQTKIGPRNILDEQAIFDLLTERSDLTEEEQDEAFDQYRKLIDDIEKQREIMQTIVDVPENRVQKKKPKRRGRSKKKDEE